MKYIIAELRTNILARITFVFFAILVAWWVTIYFRGLTEGVENNGFTLFYPILSLFGAIVGICISQKWGGVRSYLGLSLFFFSLGLLAQFAGQATLSYYIYIKLIAVPYPSLGDVGYFGSVILYIIAAFYLIRVSGAHLSLKSIKGKAVSIILPLLLLISSYFIFLNGYEFDWSNKLKIFLDLAYPLGDASYLSLALLALLLSAKVLGGIMRKPILFLIFALVFQYIADFTFLYQASKGTWYVGGVNDFLYFSSYFLMTLALIYIGSIFTKISSDNA